MGLLVIAGWELRVPALTRVMPGLTPMMPITSVSFVCSGIALWLLLPREGAHRLRVIAAQVISATVLLAGLANIAEYVEMPNLHFDRVLFSSALSVSPDPHPGRMAASTALGFTVLTVSLLLQTIPNLKALIAAQLAALFGCSIGFIALLGYIYDVRAIYAISSIASMALHSAVLLVLLGFAAFILQPAEGLPSVIVSDRLGGVAARGLLPVLIVVPVIIGWVRLKAQNAGWFGTEFGVAIIVASSVILFSIVVWINAYWLNRIDLAHADVTEHERVLAAIVASSEEAILSKDLNGIVTSWNKGAEDLYGYTAEEMIGESIAKVVPPELQDEVRHYLTEVSAGKRVTREETTRQRKDGTLIPVSLIISPVRNASGTIVQASTIAHDISARKQAQQALRDSESQLTAIISAAMDAVISVDAAQRIIMFNSAAEKMFGFRLSEMVGQPISRLIPSRFREAHKRHIESFGKTGVTSRGMATLDPLWALRADGKEFQIEASISQTETRGQKLYTVILRDVTERVQAEAALVEQAQLLAASQVFVRDLKSRVVFWPRGAEKLYGFAREEALGAVSHQLFKTEFSEPLEVIERKFAENDSWDGELVHHHRSGRRIVVASSWVMHRDDRGQPLRILETNSDITARIEAEELLATQAAILTQQAQDLSASRNALEENTLMLRSVLDSMSEGLVATNNVGEFIIWNSAAQRLIGLGPDDIPINDWTGHYGFFLADTVTPYPPDQNPLALATQGLSSDAVMFIRNPQVEDGVFLEIHANPVKDKNGAVRGGVTAFRDITSRRRIEEQVRQMEERFSKAFRSSPIAITISTKAEGRFIDANNAFLRMMGYELDEILGRTAAELDFWAKPGDREKIVEELDASGMVTLFETEFRNKYDESLTVETSAEVITLDGVACILASTHDVTEARSLEQQFRQAQKVEAIGMLAGGIAHDFNNMLAVIIGYAGLAETKLAQNSTEHLYVQHVLKAANRAAGLTRQLLTFSRRQEIEPTVLDLNEVVSNFSAMLTRVIGEQIILTIVQGESLGAIRADRGQVEQTLMNLLVNARDAMSDNGKIVVELSNADLDETFLRQHRGAVAPGSYVLLSVSDTGCGMSEDTLSKVFDPFFTTKPVGQGTGLGLPAVYGVVKQSGGHIWVYSEPGKGTSFKLYFPRIDLPADMTPGTLEYPIVERGSETILLVEDDESLRELASILLTGQGFTVLVAKDGNDALSAAKFHKGRIDVLLTDVIMPGISGGELASRFTELHPGSVVLFMSGYTSDLTTHHHLIPADTRLLQKPFTKHTLLSHVQAGLSAAGRSWVEELKKPEE